MIKQELERKMVSAIGGYFANMSEIGRFCNCGRDQVRNYTNGLDYIPKGKDKVYFIPDVVQKIWDKRIVE